MPPRARAAEPPTPRTSGRTRTTIGAASKAVTAPPTPSSRSRKRAASPPAGDSAPAKKARAPPKPAAPELNDLPKPVPPHPSGKPRTILVFGNGGSGQFGLGPDTIGDIKRPRIHAWVEEAITEGKLGPHGVERVAVGGMHNLMIDSNGKIWSWGVNDGLSLGRVTVVPGVESDELESEPHPVEGVEGFRAVQVAAGDYISLAVSDDGQLRAWGTFNSSEGLLGFDGRPGSERRQPKPLALPAFANKRIVQAVCGSDHALALTTAGHVYAWGNGQQNRLGRRIIERRKTNGLQPEVLHIKNIVLLGSGSYHSFAVDKDGVVYAWGLNRMHQTGVSDERGGWDSIVPVPTPVDALHPERHGGARVIQISGGEHHSLFLFDNGEVWGCGRCDANELGLAPDHPASIEVAKQLQEEREAKRRQLAEEQGKDVSEVELPKMVVDEHVPEPVRIAFPPPPTDDDETPELPPYEKGFSETKIVAISAGLRHNLAVSDTGLVYSWGYGNMSQLGLGNAESAETPTRIHNTALKSYHAVDVGAGGQHCVITAVKRETPLE